MMRLRLVVAFWCFSSLICRAQAPSLGFTQPAAIAPGTATDVTLFGGQLEGAARLWTTFPAEVSLTPDIPNNGAEGGKVTFRLTLSDEVPVGVGAIRVATGRGVSEPRLILIDDLPTVIDNGNNKSPETAQAINLPVAVDGTCEPESFDYYSFHVGAGQRVSVEAVAHRLGSALDPVIRLLDSAGKELAYSDDEPGLHADCRFHHEFTAEGTYLIEIRDIRYQGGGGHRYRLRVGNFPLVSVPYPMAGKADSSPRLLPLGPEVDGLGLLSVAVPSVVPGGQLFVGVRHAAGEGSAWLSLKVDGGEEQVEFEPNDQPDQASPITIPGAINGRFAQSRDRDFFQFDAKKGQRFLFVANTREFGSPSDLFMRLHKPDGAVLVEADDSGTSDGVIDFTFPEDGAYCLMVEDLHRRGGPEHAYRVKVKVYEPGFSLELDRDRFNAPQGGVFTAKVTCARRDYQGPITLSLEGLPDVTLANNVIPEKANEVVLSGTLPAGVMAGDLRVVRVTGSAQIGDKTFTASTSTLGVLKALFGGLPNPPAALDGVVALGVGPVFGDFFKLVVEPQVIQFPQLIGAATFKVKVERMNGFDEQVALAVDGLPTGFSAEVKPLEKGKGEVDIALKGPTVVAEGDYPFNITGSATFQDQPRSVVLAGVRLQVVSPLVVSVEPAGPLTAGQKQKVKVRLTRFGEAQPAVALTWQGLPLGVKAPEDLTIAEGQSEIEVELEAAPDAAIGHFATLRVIGSTQIQGRDIQAMSEAAALDVQMQ